MNALSIISRFWIPPARSPLWYLPPDVSAISARADRADKDYLAPSTVRVTVPITTTGQPCPVTPENIVEWTEAQREIATRAPSMASVQQLESDRKIL